jgi:hypothetical protein
MYKANYSIASKNNYSWIQLIKLSVSTVSFSNCILFEIETYNRTGIPFHHCLYLKFLKIAQSAMNLFFGKEYAYTL